MKLLTLYYMGALSINYKDEMKKSILFKLFLILFVAGRIFSSPLYGATKRPVPRFVSLRSNENKIRVAPGREYPVKWTLKRKGLPVKVIAEYDTWRQVECHDGTTGWIHQGLLTGRRTLMAQGKDCRLLSSANRDAYDKAKIASNTLMTFKVKDCKSGRCYIKVQGQKGWIRKSQVWGLLESE